MPLSGQYGYIMIVDLESWMEMRPTSRTLNVAES